MITVPLRLAAALLLAVAPTTLVAQGPAPADTTSGPDWRNDPILTAREFVTPPPEIAEAALAPRWLNVTLNQPNPDRSWFLNQVGDGPVDMATFSRPQQELGGLFFDVGAHRHRNLTIRNNVGIDLHSADDGRTISIEVPEGARVSNASWSPDGTKVAYFAHFDDATHIYVADATSGRSRRITPRPVLATLLTSFAWTAGGAEIATVLLPSGRPEAPREPAVPTGPQVVITEEGRNALRTYASLMATPHEEDLLEWYATGQLALVSTDGSGTVEVGEPAMIRGIDPAPDGEHLIVTRMVRPFSYIVPVNNFGRVEEIWDRQGTVLTELRTVALNTGRQSAGSDDDGDDGPPERRQLAWRPDGAGLTFLQQEPAPEDSTEADAAADAPTDAGSNSSRRRMDRVMQWLPPFRDGSETVVYETATRMQSHTFADDMSALFITERQGQNNHQYAVFLDDPETKHTLVRWSNDDFYARPGSLLTESGPGAATVRLSADGSAVFFTGIQYDEDPLTNGPRSFVDRVTIRTGEKERVYESSNDGEFERITTVIDPDLGDYVVTRESPTEIAQSYRVRDGSRVQLTENVDYTPDLTHAPVQRFIVTRPDGFRFRVTVTLPPGYREGTRLPAMFWFYPREYDDQESYDNGARTYNRNAFPNFGTRSMQYLVRLGYAVVEPDAPIVGPQGRMNDNYEHDLRNNLAAVIDELDHRQIIDRRRLGLGGHSYGAFSTVNAMVHTPFFKAGIAGDGNYNRTLTPMAFQSERRWLWEAKDVYLSMSPFMHANDLTGALLLYHGLQDQNVGTHPSHSPRLFHALNGLEKDAAMYNYPFEDHGPATRETILDLWARWTAWLDLHLREGPDNTRSIVLDQDGTN